MFQDGPVNRNLDIIIRQSQGKVEKNRHLIEDGKKDRKGASEREMDDCKKENRIPLAGHELHGTPMKRVEKQLSGERPKWRRVLISRSRG